MNTMIDFETAIEFMDDEAEQDDKIRLRCEVLDAIKNTKFERPSNQMCEFQRASDSLREKKNEVYFTKADKSNNIVILNRDDYIQSTEEFIQNGPYEEVAHDPLPGMIRRTKAAVKRAADVFVSEEYLTLRLHVSNPIIPRLYVQRKLHKPGQKVRPITPNNNAPTEKLAVWLLKKFNSMKIKFESSSIKNSIEFVNNIKDVEIEYNEIQASFDVESLFPSVPIDTTLSYLRDWLNKNNINQNEIAELINLTKICMNENWFQFNGKYYRQNHGFTTQPIHRRPLHVLL